MQPRRPLHRRARAVHDRHGALRRHRAAGDDADRGDRRRDVVGSPVPRLERGRRSHPLGESVSNSELHRRLAAAMGFTEPALFDDDMTRDPRRAADGRRRPAPRGRLPARAVPRGRPSVRRRRVPDRVRQGRAVQRRARVDGARRRCRRSSPPRESLSGDAGARRAVPVRAAHAEAAHPLPELGLLAAPEARPRRGRAVRRAVRRTTPRRSVSPTARSHVCGTTAPRCACRSAITGRLRPRVVAIPFGWWSAHHADGMVANSLTNDTLTDWGGGVAFSDTLVAVRSRLSPDAHRVVDRLRRRPRSLTPWQASSSTRSG